MIWVLGALVLVVVGFILHRVLYPRGDSFPVSSPIDPLDKLRETIYQPLAQDMKGRSGIIAVSLNEVFEQDQRGEARLASGMISLAADEWLCLGHMLLSVQDLMLKYMPLLRFAVPLRSHSPLGFRSAVMVDLVRSHEEIEQFVYRPRLRFHIHLSVLRTGGHKLTEGFCRSAAEASEVPAGIRCRWSLMEVFFHDFDLVVKDSLMALRMVLAALPDEAIHEFGSELEKAAGRKANPSLLAPRV